MEIQLTSDKYIVAKSEDNKIIHLIFITSNSTFKTGQPIVEQFDTLEEATSYIDVIKGEGYTRDNFKNYFEIPQNPNE